MASKQQQDAGFLTADQVVEVWGEQWKDLAAHQRVHFTEGEVHIDLSSAIPVAGSEGGSSKQIVLVEPDVAALKTIDAAKGEVAKAAALIQCCGDLTGASVNKIKGRDFILLNKVVAAFLSDGHQTGET